MHIELILATGSRAGTTATIMKGYYMIGRAKECQIRPKTKSVSRRHCVVFHDVDTFKVLDLASTSGTKINHQRIEPNVWCELRDGDELSCGKIRFRVAIEAKRTSASKPGDQSPSTTLPATVVADHSEFRRSENLDSADAPANQGMVAGDAWQSFDIANFLESQDDADREQRYERIRKTHSAAVLEDQEYGSDDDEFNTNLFDSGDIDVDTTVEADEATSNDSSIRPATEVDARAEKTELAHGEVSARRQAKEGRSPISPSRPEKGLAQRVFSLFSGDLDRLKLVAAIIVTLVILGFIASQAFEFVSGPPVRVIENLD